jgi:hypothetical protein
MFSVRFLLLELNPNLHLLLVSAWCMSAKHSFPVLLVLYVTVLISRKDEFR